MLTEQGYLVFSNSTLTDAGHLVATVTDGGYVVQGIASAGVVSSVPVATLVALGLGV